jgi:acetyl esterase/lipase
MTCPQFVHLDYWALLGGQAPPPAPAPTEIDAIRRMSDGWLKASSDETPFPTGMKTSVYTTTSSGGKEVTITRFQPLSTQQKEGADGAAAAQRAAIFTFGGGLITGSVHINYNTIAHLAELWSTQVFAPDYRVAPENPFPAGLDDVYSTLTWLQDCGKAKFNVDPARIVLFGMSAGANLVAATALKARDMHLEPPIAAQILRYPMIDDRASMEADDPRLPYLSWTMAHNKTSWDAYLDRQNSGKQQLGVPWRLLMLVYRRWRERDGFNLRRTS